MHQRQLDAPARKRRLAERTGSSNVAATTVDRLVSPPFTVIIPALDEEPVLFETIAHLNGFRQVDEVIVVDGGSRDATVQVAEAAGARVLRASRGRGPQMNAGARAAQHGHLMFLHADCRLPPDAFRCIEEVFAGGHDAGLFAIDFGSPHVVLRTMSKLSRWSTPWTQFGEAALFMSRRLFDAVGGFPDWPLMEDVEMLRRLRRRSQLARARGTVQASPRRFLENGIWRQTLRNFWCYTLFQLGMPPSKLVDRYAGKSVASLNG